MAQSKYDDIVRRFLDEENGEVVYLSDDARFPRLLRGLFSRELGIKRDALLHLSTPAEAAPQIARLRDEGTPCVLFMERMHNNRPTTDTLLSLKREFPDLRVIMLTWEATQETVAYFFELGVNRVLVKPVSANKLLQALAHALNPPGFLKKQMAKCEQLLRDGDFYEALDLTDRILLIKPDSARALTMRGDALMGIDEDDKAVQSYMTAHEVRPIFMAPLIKLAAAFRDMEDERALDYMMILDQISPLNPERKVDIAEQYLLRNETEEAEAYLDQGMAVAEREVQSMVGDLTTRIVDAVFGVAPQLAAKYLHRVIDAKRQPGLDDLVHFNRLGMILRGEGKWEEAVDIYRRALLIADHDPALHYNMGLAYWEGGERTKALACFESALQADPLFHAESVGATLNIGLLYYDLRLYNDAEPFFQHVLNLDPGNKAAQKRLSAILQKKAA